MSGVIPDWVQPTTPGTTTPTTPPGNGAYVNQSTMLTVAQTGAMGFNDMDYVSWPTVAWGTFDQVPRSALEDAVTTFDRQTNIVARSSGLPVTYGQDRIGARVLCRIAYGDSLLVVVIWGAGPVSALTNFTVANATSPSDVTATHYLGTATQTSDPKLIAAYAAIGVTFSSGLPGVVYSVVQFGPTANIGEMHIVVTGRLLYDPRTTATAYSDNPSLALADLLTNSTYGLNASIDWASVIDAANANDALTSGEKKRLIGYTLTERKTWRSHVDVLRAHAGVMLTLRRGVYRLVPYAAASSVFTFNKSLIVDGSLTWAVKPLSDSPNVVEVEYTDTSVTPWATKTVSFPDSGIPVDGSAPRLTRVQYPGVQRSTQARREAIERYNAANLQRLAFSLRSYAVAAPVEVGDVVTINDGRLFTGVLARVLGKRYTRKGEIEFALTKYDPAVFDSSAIAAATTPNTTMGSATAPPSVTALAITEISAETASGYTTQLRVMWTATTWPFLRDYHVMIYDESALVQEGYTTTAGFTTQPVAIGHNYRVVVYVRSSLAQGTGVMSAYTVNGSTSAAPGEMLWGAYAITPGASYTATAYQRGIGDVQKHNHVTKGSGGYATSFQPFSTLGTLSGIGPIENALYMSYVAPPSYYPGSAYTPTTPAAALAWSSTAITPFAGAHRRARMAASLDVRAYQKSTNGVPQIAMTCVPYLNGVAQSSSTTFGNVRTVDTASVTLGVYTSENESYFAAEVNTPGTLYVYTPTTTETQSVTSSASGALTVTCANNFARLKGAPIVTPQTISPRYPVINNITYGSACTFDIRVYDDAGALTSTPCTISIEGTI